MVLKYLPDINFAVRYKIVRLGTKLFGIMKVSSRCAASVMPAPTDYYVEVGRPHHCASALSFPAKVRGS